MPRLYDEEGDAIDLCVACWEDEVDETGPEPIADGRYYGCDVSAPDEHPPYEYEDYSCDVCGVLLDAEDN